MLSDKRVRKNRDSLGAKIKSAREKEGYTQKALASELGLEYYTMISQMELGYISIPASLWVPLAITLKMDVSMWCLMCLIEYQPEVYSALFANRPKEKMAQLLNDIRKGKYD